MSLPLENESVNKRSKHYLTKLEELFDSAQIAFDKSNNLPTTAGIYRILEFGVNGSNSIYVGKTNNFRRRIYSNLLMGTKQAHTLKRKLIANRRFKDEAAITRYLKNKCRIQIFQLPDKGERSLFEHFAIAVLRPEHND